MRCTAIPGRDAVVGDLTRTLIPDGGRSMRKPVVAIVVSTFALASLASAAEGRIPVLSLSGPPYLITSPGDYILTRDLGPVSGFNIQILSDGVTLDLGGHTVSSTAGFTGPAISVKPGSGTRLVSIKNGQIVGGAQGIAASTATELRLEGLDVSGGLDGLIVVASLAEIVDCHVHDLTSLPGSSGTGISLTAAGGRVSGNLVQNVPGNGIVLTGLHGGEVRRNVIRNFGSGFPAQAGIYLNETFAGGGPGGNIVADNTVDGTPGSDDEGVHIQSPYNLVSGNVVTSNGTYGIQVHGNENRLERNVTNGNGSDGVFMNSGMQRNRFDANQAQGNLGCGLNLAGTFTTIYSNGTYANNGTAAICGTGGINAGGNYCDSLPCP